MIAINSFESSGNTVVAGSVRDIILPGGRPTRAASFWLTQAKSGGSLSSELREVFTELLKWRLIVLGCADFELLDEAFESLAAWMNGKLGGNLAILAGEVPSEIDEPAVEPWLRRFARTELPVEGGPPPRALIRLNGTDPASFGILSAIRRLRSRDLEFVKTELERSERYIVVLSPIDIVEGAHPRLLGTMWHKISFLAWRLRQADAENAESILDLFKRQQARGLWPSKEVELYDELQDAIFGDRLADAIRNRQQGRPRAEQVEGAVAIGSDATAIETTAIYLAAFLPGLSRSAYDSLIGRLLAGEEDPQAGSSLRERWKKESAAILAACGISASPRAGDRGAAGLVLEVQIESGLLREHYRRQFVSIAFLRYLELSERLLELRPIFEQDTKLRNLSARLLVDLSIAYPEQFGLPRLEGWILGWIRESAAQDPPAKQHNLARALARKLEAIFRAGSEVGAFGKTAGALLQVLLDSEHWEVGTEILRNLRNLEGFDVYGNWLIFLRRARFAPRRKGRKQRDLASEKLKRVADDLENHAVSSSEAFYEAFAKLSPWVAASAGPSPAGGEFKARDVLLSVIVRSLDMSRFDFDPNAWGFHALAGTVAVDPKRLREVAALVLDRDNAEDTGLHVTAFNLKKWLLPPALSGYVGDEIYRTIWKQFRTSILATPPSALANPGRLLLLTWLMADLSCSCRVDRAEEALLMPIVQEVLQLKLERPERKFVALALTNIEAGHLAMHTALRRSQLDARQPPKNLGLAVEKWGEFRENIRKLRVAV